jgi:hypothetical protein
MLGVQALRTDNSLPLEQPGTAKMVSLDLLLGANSTPATPREPQDAQLPVGAVAASAWSARSLGPQVFHGRCLHLLGYGGLRQCCCVLHPRCHVIAS